MKELCLLPVAGCRYGWFDWATHVPALITTLSRLKPKTILELGAGDYSTSVLHAYGMGDKRITVTSLENDFNPGWLDGLGWMNTNRHKLVKVDNWDLTAYDRNYDLVFIDQGPEHARIPSLEFFSSRAKVVVLHDCNYRNRYMPTLEKMGYCVYDRTHRFHTLIASNDIDVTEWFKDEQGVTTDPSWPVQSIDA